MRTIDWIIVAFVVLMAAYGYLQGFVIGVLSLLGFALGAVAGTRIAPLLLAGGSRSPYAPLFGLLGALIGGAILATGFEGVGIGLRMRMRSPAIGIADGLLGAVLTAAVGLGIVWVVGAVALQTPGMTRLRRDIQRSQVLRRLNTALPPSGLILHALARFDPFPRISGPGANVGPPPRGIGRVPGVRAAAAGVVRVTGTACGLGVEGSGWIARPGLVVTNAHVVAGETDTKVQLGGSGPGLSAQAVHFDTRNDVAVLRVGGLGGHALALAPNPAPGTAGAILGFPHNGPFDVEPGRIGQTQTVVSQDAYGRGPVTRSITPLRGLVRSGNSGGPLVDRAGRVLTTVFAATVGGRTGGGYGVPDAIVRDALALSRGQVGTGPCAS